GHVDDAGVLDLVRAFARVPGQLSCRLDDVSISLIEIEILVLLEIGLLAVAHNHKATGHGVLRLAKGPPFQISGPRLADISIKTLTRRIATAAHPRRSWLKDFKVKVRSIDLLLGRRLSDALERRNTIDRVELLDDFRIDVTAPERGQALFSQ